MTHNYNAHLRYTDEKGKDHYFYFWVMGYTQPFELAGTEEQSLKYKHFYAKSYAPGDMTVSGRAAYQTEYNNLSDYLRQFHMRLINSTPASNAQGDFIPTLKLVIPAEGVSVHGLVKSFKAGAKRFNVAPPFTFDFMVISNDHQASINFTSSYTIRDTWTGALVGTAHPQPKKKKHHKPAPKHIHHRPRRKFGGSI